jgi:Ca2+-binding RTX toxin-like protein
MSPFSFRVAAGLTTAALLVPVGADAVAPSARCDGRAATTLGTAGEDHVVGTPGADVIVAFGGDDRIEAGPGYLQRDTVVHRTVDHAIDADLWPGVGRVQAEGVDTVRVHGQSGVYGTDAADEISGADEVLAYDGHDTCLNAERVRSCEVRQTPAPDVRSVMCSGRAATILGTEGRDKLDGTRGDDVIAGLGGDDRIAGLDGDDVVCGGPGDDELTSYDKGRDVLVGGAGDDFVGSFENPHARVRLGSGDDYASSQIGLDPGWSLDGGPGRDHLFLNLTLALHEAGPMLGSIDLREGRLAVHPGGRTVSGDVASWEELDIPHNVRWDVRGSSADERFLFEGLYAIRVRAGAGDDEILGTPGDDVILAGEGEDTVTAYGGTDVCRGAEHTRGCDLRR